jgi:outer membrane protein assembly factor BamB
MSYWTFVRVIVGLAMVALLPCVAGAAEEPGDSLARVVLGKAGIRVGVCEMPQVGDGSLAASMAKLGVPQVHALASDAKAAEAARGPSAAAGVLGSQVIIETGKPDALPLGDWVADLYVVADATDASLKSLSASEAGRVLSPYRGVAVVGNPTGAQGGLTKDALAEWAKGTGGTAAIGQGASGLWAVVKMPPLAGGDDWSHYYHGPDGSPVSQDAAFRGRRYQLQWHDYPIEGERNYTVVASAGRLFVATCSMYFGTAHAWLRPQCPYELEARSLYNARVLWRRPISAYFGDMGSLLVATPDRLYAKDGDGVLVLNAETGAEVRRIAVTAAPRAVRWLALADGVLVTLAGPPPFDEKRDAPRSKGELDADYARRVGQASRQHEACQEAAGWDAATGKPLWQYKDARIYPTKTVISAGRVFLYVNDREALCLDLATGKVLWRQPAPSSPAAGKPCDASERRGEMYAAATPKAYVIFDHFRKHYQAFDAADGHELWALEKGRDYPPDWPPAYPVIMGDTFLMRGIPRPQIDVFTGKPVNTYPALGAPAVASDSCGHATAVASGLWIGNGVVDLQTGKQVMPGLDKSGCGLGFFVANGTEVLFPNVCTCYYVWSGAFAVRPVPPREPREGTRFERGDAPAPKESSADACDWPTHRADETRRGSSATEVPATAGIRWIHTPAQPTFGYAAALPLHLRPDPSATQPISVGKDVYFGTADGAVVCLERGSGAERWRYWTAGAIRAAPTWALGRLYVGSSDGWAYCLDAASGKLCWRYRVAMEERRLALLGRLGSAWPVWSSVLVHDGVAYAAAGLRGKLDGSTLCALDARSGAVKWRKDFQSTGETDAKGNLVNQAPSGGGSLAWYDGKLWWHGGEWGPAVVDPASGAMKRAIDYRPCRDFRYGLNQDLGVLPGGWVVFGGWKPVRGARAVAGSYQAPALFLRTGPDGLPAGDPASTNLKDAASVPHFLKLTNLDPTGSTRVNRQIPAWDERDVLLPGDFTAKDKAPILCQGLAAWLNSQDDARLWTVDEANKKQGASMQDLPRVAALASLPADRQRPALSDDLAAAVNNKQFTLSGLMVLASNAVVFAGARDSSWPGTDLRNWRVVAVNRADHAKLWEVALPAPPALSGMSLTRDGDVLIPLEDGRVICVGPDAPEAQPLPAVTVADAKPGLAAADYVSDWVEAGYVLNWNQADFAILKPANTRVLAACNFKDEKKTEQTVLHAWGYLEVPSTGRYRFLASAPGGTFTLYDRTGRTVACKFNPNPWSATSDEVFLEQGKHPIELVVLAGDKGRSLALQWEGPGIKRSDIPATALWRLPESGK